MIKPYPIYKLLKLDGSESVEDRRIFRKYGMAEQICQQLNKDENTDKWHIYVPESWEKI